MGTCVHRFFSQNHCISRIVLGGKANYEQAQHNHNEDIQLYNVNKKINKTKSLNEQHTFWHVSLPSLHD